MGNAHPNVVPYQDFPTADGDMILAVGNDSQFARLCEVMGRPELARDPRFKTGAARVRCRDELIPLLRGITAQRYTADWVQALESAGVPCGPINTIDRVFSDPQVLARGLRVEMQHPVGGTVPVVASPLRMSETPVEYRTAPPLLGEHTRAVLREMLALDDAALETLAAARVI
jgi:crotonobetainyl-CoA:carnitine CoA-transferase CaiB-like acyl-CoA transferase